MSITASEMTPLISELSPMATMAAMAEAGAATAGAEALAVVVPALAWWTGMFSRPIFPTSSGKLTA